jgi:prepilin-type processing-associated H-X9-DG protein
MQRISLQDIADWEMGTAADAVRLAIDADLNSHDSRVQEYLDWAGGVPNRPTPRLVREHFANMPPETRAALENLSFDDDDAPEVAFRDAPAMAPQPVAEIFLSRTTVDQTAEPPLPGTVPDSEFGGTSPVPPATVPPAGSSPAQPDGEFQNTGTHQPPAPSVLASLPFYVLRLAALPGHIAIKGAQALYHKVVRRVQPDSTSISEPSWPPERPSRLKWLLEPAAFDRNAFRFSPIELVTGVAIIAVLIGILLPGIQGVREAARRAQCANNLRQLAQAALNYHTSHGTFPMGDHMGRNLDGSLIPQDFGHFVAISQYYEQGQIFNALNCNLMIYLAPNSTVSGFGMKTLWCPSDSGIASLRYSGKPGDGWDGSPIPMTFSSYAGNGGPYVYEYDDPHLSQSQGIFSHRGNAIARGRGTWTNSPPVTLAAITDGASHTFLYGEHAQEKMVEYSSATGKNNKYGINRWSSGDLGETIFSSMFPPNWFTIDPKDLQPNVLPQIVPRNSNWANTVTSSHPGGANFAFCDGSVRFIKNTGNSWNPRKITGNRSEPGSRERGWIYNLNAQVGGVYQALSTRNGGDVVSSDQY